MSDVVAANIWSFLMASDLLFIPTLCFHGETFDYFLHQIQRRIDTRNMHLIQYFFASAMFQEEISCIFEQEFEGSTFEEAIRVL